MATILPYEKLSKKKKKEIDKARRATWGEISPVTRKPENPKAYNRRKAQRWEKDPHVEPFCIRCYILFDRVPSISRASRADRCRRSSSR